MSKGKLERFVEDLFNGDEIHLTERPLMPTEVPVIIERFRGSTADPFCFGCLRVTAFGFLRLLRDVWPQADVGEVRPCNRCPQLQVVEDLPECPSKYKSALETFHFWNEAVKRRLTVNVAYYATDKRCTKYFLETNYVSRDQRIRHLTIFVDDRRCPGPKLARCGRAVKFDVVVLADAFLFLSRRQLETCQLVSRWWRLAVDNLPQDAAPLRDIVRIKERDEANVMVHCAPRAPDQFCECITVPKQAAENHFGDELGIEAYARLKLLLRNAFVRYVFHYASLRNFLLLLEECTRERIPLRVEAFMIFRGCIHQTGFLVVLGRLRVQKYLFVNVMNQLHTLGGFDDRSLQSARAVHFRFGEGEKVNDAVLNRLPEFVFISNDRLRLALSFDRGAEPPNLDAFIQTFLEANDLSQMAACVDLEYVPEGPPICPLRCTTMAQKKVGMSMVAGALAVKGPILDRLGGRLRVDEGSPNLLFDVFHFHNARCDQWLTVVCSAATNESGTALLRLARGKLLFNVDD